MAELLIVDAVGAFDLAAQVRSPRPDVDVADIERLEMPMKVSLEFGAIVGLHDLDSEGQPSAHVLNEGDRRTLMTSVKDFHHADRGCYRRSL